MPIIPISYSTEDKSNSFSLTKLVSNNPNPIVIDDYNISDTTSSKSSKIKKSKKKTKTMSDGNEMVPADSNLQQYQTNEPYLDTYEETNNALKIAVTQIDVIANELKTDLNTIRSSKTLKNKYNYIPNIANTLSSLMNTKVTAIRELNKTITDSHNLELKRIKDLKMNEQVIDDDKAIMDMYNAFISMPMGGAPPQLAPTMSEMSLQNGISNIVRATVGGEGDYNSYANNLNPVQNAMRYEHNPDVKTVVVFNQSTGARYFDVMNIRTGESIPNIDRPDPMFLEDTTIDINNGIARNTNLDQTYPLIVMGENTLKY